jgi:hypothetical protein
MAEHERTSQKKQDEVDQKRRNRQQESQPLLGPFHAWEQGTVAITETPFWPRMDEHAESLAMPRSDGQQANLVLHLQHTYGNRYVQRLIESMGVQTRLAVSAPNDAYEQEADRVAETVNKAENAPLQRQEEEEEPIQPKSIAEIQRQPEEELEEDEEVLRPKSVLQRQEEEPIQPKLLENPANEVTENLDQRIKTKRGGGQPLTDMVREPMEQAFGADFSGTRTHTDSEANMLDQQLSAKAFTTGQDIFFREGEYEPDSDSGEKLIAHELTHVVQQKAATALQRDIAEVEVKGELPHRVQLFGNDPTLDPSYPRYGEDADEAEAGKERGKEWEVTLGEVVIEDEAEAPAKEKGKDDPRLAALQTLWLAEIELPLREAYELLEADEPDTRGAQERVAKSMETLAFILASYPEGSEAQVTMDRCHTVISDVGSMIGQARSRDEVFVVTSLLKPNTGSVAVWLRGAKAAL